MKKKLYKLSNSNILTFMHIPVEAEDGKEQKDFYISEGLLTWGVLYDVGVDDCYRLEDGHDSSEIVLALNADCIYSFFKRLSERVLEDSEKKDWEVCLPNSWQWHRAHRYLGFTNNSGRSVVERTTTMEPLYSTRDSNLMREHSFVCCEPISATYCKESYNRESCQCNVAIRMVLQRRDKTWDGVFKAAEELFGKFCK